MPQFDMLVLDPELTKDARVEQHTAGKPLRSGGGNETYRCGSCKTKLLVDVSHRDAHGAIIQCGKCGRINVEPHHAQH